MVIQNPRDADPSITGLPHQQAGKDSALIGHIEHALVTG